LDQLQQAIEALLHPSPIKVNIWTE